VIKITKNALTTMTLADIENLLDEKDKLIAAASVEIKALKEENEINYYKLQDISKRNAELSADLHDEKLRNGKEDQMKEINKLKLVITEKSQLIEEERKRLEELRVEFNKRLDERTQLEDEILRNSMHIPERMIENSEKAGLFQKIQSLRMQINKLKTDNEKTKKQTEEMKAKNKEIDDKRQKLSEENKNLLTLQVNDTKSISRLTKEKEELKEKMKELKNELKQKTELLTKGNEGVVSNAVSGEGGCKFEESVVVTSVTPVVGEQKRALSKSKANVKYTKKNPEPFQIEKKDKKAAVTKQNIVIPSIKVVADPSIKVVPKQDKVEEKKEVIPETKQFNINY